MNRLPPDILCHITRYVPDNNARDTRSIIPLTHVCRYWRESLVSTPTIWTLISNRSKSLTTLSLKRSKAAPLEIDLNLSIRDYKFFDLLLPHIRNTGSLNIRGLSSIEALTQALPNFPQSTPNLRSLTLHCAAYRSTEQERSIDPFESLADTLRYLSLDHFPLYHSFLRLKSLTEFHLLDHRFNVHLDTLLQFLKESHSLESATINIRFAEPSLRSSNLAAAVENRLRYLSVHCSDLMDGKALISGIALQRGAHLELFYNGSNATPRDILSGDSMKHLPNLSSPTFIECKSYCRSIRLFGPNGGFSFRCLHGPEDPILELLLLRLTFTNVQEFRFIYRRSQRTRSPLRRIMFNPSLFPALKMLAVSCETDPSHFFSTVFSNPSSSPSLKTLAFLDCNLTEDFIEELKQFASGRKNTTSAWLHRVAIVNSNGKHPSVSSIDALEKHVPVVDVRMGKEFPKDLT